MEARRQIMLAGATCETESVSKVLDGAGFDVRTTPADPLPESVTAVVTVLSGESPTERPGPCTAWLGRGVPVIVVVPAGSESVGRECVQEGAQDYVVSNDLERLPGALEREIAVNVARQRRSQALADAERRYQGVLQSFHDIYYRSTLDGLLLSVSPSVAELGGYEPAALVGRDVRELYADAGARDKLLAHILEKGRVRDVEIQLKTVTGEIRDASLSAHVIRDEQGRPCGVEGALQDITERKRIEAALRQSEEKYRQVVEGAADPIFGVDRSGRFTFVNSVAASYFGRKPEEFPTTTMWDWFPKPVADIQMDTIREVFASGEGRSYVSPSQIGGEERWFSTDIRPVRDVAGNIRAAHLIARDITELKRMEHALRESEEKYRQLVESAADPILIIGRDGLCQFANAGAAGFFNRRPDDLVGTRLDRWFLPDTAREYGALITRVIEEHAGQTFEVSGEIDGITRWFSVDLRPLDSADGNLERVEVIAREITALKHADQAVRESEERYRLLVEGAGDPIAVLDGAGEVLFVNAVGARLLGHSPADLVGWRLTDGLPAEIAGTYVADLRAVLTWGVGRTVVHRILTEGEGRWYSFSLQPLHDSDGKARRVQVIGRDITAQKRAEETVARTERLYRTLAEHIPNGAVFLFDGGLRFTLAEGRGLVEVGPERSAFEGRTVGEVFPAELASRLEPEFRAALQGEHRVFEVPWAGHEYVVHALPVRDEGDAILGGMAMTQDITELKHSAEERERLITELQEAVSSIRRLHGLIPICASCKKIRNDQGYWQQVEDYVREHSDAVFSHGLCGECVTRLYPEFADDSASRGGGRRR
jgi:PAS domain S-box-containing protein